MNTYNVSVNVRESGALGVFGESVTYRVHAADEWEARMEAIAEANVRGYETRGCTRVELED